MDQPRRLAVQLLQRSEENGYANLLLKSALDKCPLDARDKQFVSVLVYGTLEKQYTLDALLNLYLKKPVQKLDSSVRAILRCGLYQCRYLDSVPVYAAVNAAVELTRKCGKSSAAGMVNAVLRKAAVADEKLLTFTDEIDRLSVSYNASPSIVAMLCQAYPQKAEAILSEFSGACPVFIRVNTLRVTPDELCRQLKQQGVEAEECGYSGALRILNGDFLHTPAFVGGLFHIQGLASQAAANAVVAKPGEKVLDLCCAPGGKSLTMAYAMQGKGKLFCRELQPARLPLIEKQLQRCGVTNAEICRGDATVFEPALAGADAVLCDVPCSGTGTLSKKPDIRFKNIDETREALVRTQLAILENAARYPKPGGRLIYSTCSLDPAENIGVVSRFLAAHTDYTPVELSLPQFTCIKRDNTLTLLPENGKNDGFFIAKLIKV